MAETKKAKRERMRAVIDRLSERYPSAECSLEYGGDPWRLLVMGRLSAQCTDERVNIVCRELFRVFPDARSMAEAPLCEIEGIIKPCGLYRAKAFSLKESSRMLVEEYGGVMPSEMDSLLRFPGVGRKIANLIIGDIFSLPAIVCDTHCIRITGRLGMYRNGEKNLLRIERALAELVEGAEGSELCHRLVLFGRDVCTARSPHCGDCPLYDLCVSRGQW